MSLCGLPFEEIVYSLICCEYSIYPLFQVKGGRRPGCNACMLWMCGTVKAFYEFVLEIRTLSTGCTPCKSYVCVNVASMLDCGFGCWMLSVEPVDILFQRYHYPYSNCSMSSPSHR